MTLPWLPLPLRGLGNSALLPPLSCLFTTYRALFSTFVVPLLHLHFSIGNFVCGLPLFQRQSSIQQSCCSNDAHNNKLTSSFLTVLQLVHVTTMPNNSSIHGVLISLMDGRGSFCSSQRFVAQNKIIAVRTYIKHNIQPRKGNFLQA